MAVQTVFKRYELKYLLTTEQKTRVLAEIAPYMELDSYGRTTIRNLYYDTDTYLLIRRSIEKPAYKEKLRLRSYSTATADSTVFAELKKKWAGVVYKRRLALPNREAMAWLAGQTPCPEQSQIAGEIGYVLSLYGRLQPKVYLSYQREAYYCKDGGDFRVTFDDNILCRQEDLSLEAPPYGTRILPEDMVLMELKCSGGIPMWMTRVLSAERLYKTSYSKYGTAYTTLIFPHLQSSKEHISQEAETDA